MPIPRAVRWALALSGAGAAIGLVVVLVLLSGKTPGTVRIECPDPSLTVELADGSGEVRYRLPAGGKHDSAVNSVVFLAAESP